MAEGAWAQRSRVATVEGFLSQAEAQQIRALGAACFRRKRIGRASGHAAVAVDTDTVGTSSCPAGSHSPLLSRVEARIGALTGLPSHEGEEGLMVTQQHPGATDAIVDPSRVHHDRINPTKERRALTVLIYLSSSADEDGGHTVFPFLAGAQAGEGGARLAGMAHTVARAFDRGMRSLGCHTCAQLAAVPPSAEETTALESAHRHAEEECLHARQRGGQVGSVAVRPRVGTALLFWHAFPNGTADPFMWHAGCLAGSGARWALQKFKTPPDQDTPAALAAAAGAWSEDTAQRWVQHGEKSRARTLDVAVASDGRASMRASASAEYGRQHEDDRDEDELDALITQATSYMLERD